MEESEAASLSSWRWSRLDFAAIVVIVLSSPLRQTLGSVVYRLESPDAIAYATMGERLFSQGRLYIESWGHVDSGLILPPLLPLLVAVGGLFDPNSAELGSSARMATLINNLAALVFSVACYRLLCPLSNRVVALIAVLTLPLFLPYMRFASSPLTEMVFMLGLAGSLVLLGEHLRKCTTRSGISLGLACALTALTRQAGFFALGFCVLWIAIDALRQRDRTRAVVRQLLPVLAAWAMVYGAYSAVLYAQTHAPPTSQWFRQGGYQVSTSDPRVLKIIEAIRQVEDTGYDGIYRARRMMRKLLPDSSEMYEFVRIVDSTSAASSSASAWTSKLAEFPTNVRTNFRILYDFIGPVFFALFFAALVSAYFESNATLARPPPTGQRGMLGAFVCFYLLALSLLTSLVTRYVEVVIPFVVLQVGAELWRNAARIRALESEWRASVVCCACIALATLSIGHRADLSRFTEYRYDDLPYGQLRDYILPGDGVITPSPLDAYLLQASWRILPNDGPRRVLEYAQITETPWLLVSKARHNAHQIRLYKHKWYTDANVLQLKEVGFEPVARFADGDLVLYRIPTAQREAKPHANENGANSPL